MRIKKQYKKEPARQKMVYLNPQPGDTEMHCYDLAELRKQDQEQGRYHLTADEVEAAIKLGLMRNLLDDAVFILERYAKQYKIWHLVRCASGLLKKAMCIVRDTISCEQLIMISNNVNGAECLIVHDENMAPPMTVVVGTKHMAEIINQATRVCALTCTLTRDQSKTCPLRNAFDNVPALKKDARCRMFDGSMCPYYLYEIDEEAFGNVYRK